MNYVTIFSLFCLSFALTAEESSPIAIDVTDTVKVSARPLGMNMGGSTYYDSPILKHVVRNNFEGTVYRQCHEGMLYPDGFTTAYASKQDMEKRWEKLGMYDLFPGMSVTVISGPCYGFKTKIKEVGYREYALYENTKPKLMCHFVFEDEVPLPDGQPLDGMGIFLEKDARHEGYAKHFPGASVWGSSNYSVVTGDVHPDSFGQAAVLLDGTKEAQDYDKETRAYKPMRHPSTRAFYMFMGGWGRYADLNGTWHVKFKAKAVTTEHNFRILPVVQGYEAKLSPLVPVLTDTWDSYEQTLTIDCFTRPYPDTKSGGSLSFLFEANGGKILFDDVEIWNAVDTNPTAFRDDAVEALKQLNPGILRYATMGGVPKNDIMPPMQRYNSHNRIEKPSGPYGVDGSTRVWNFSEHLELCEYLSCSSWYNVPGTLHEEEIDIIVEFLAGPIETEGGKIRAAQGHPQPWTETISEIHIEIGNEPWNDRLGFLAGGYDGPDYWENIFKRIKESPYYKKNIVLHASGQNYLPDMTRRILSATPSADCYSIAPYQIHGVTKQQYELLKNEKSFFRWAVAHPLVRSYGKHLKRQMDAISAFDCEFSVYEQGWHITGGDLPLEPRNRFVTSLPAGVAIINHLLLQMRDFGFRYQNFFCFTQHSVGIPRIGPVRLWGSVLSLRPEKFRFRPTGYAFKLANEVLQLRGDMMETVHPDNQPMFTSAILEKSPKSTGRKKIYDRKEDQDFACIWSYVVKTDAGYGVILINLDLDRSFDVTLNHGSVVEGAVQQKVLSAKHYADNNEFESVEMNVTHQESVIGDPAVTPVHLPPHSMITLQWSAKANE